MENTWETNPITAEPGGMTSEVLFPLNILKWNWGRHLRIKASNRTSLTFSFGLFFYSWFQCCVSTTGFLVACEQALHLGISWKVDAREARERRRKSGGLENFNMANDSDYHFFRFTISQTPLDSPVPRPSPYLFQRASVQNHLPHYNPSQIVPPPLKPHSSPSTRSET